MPHLRKINFTPKLSSDTGGFLLMACMIPFTYIWEVCIVGPKLYPEATISWYIHMVIGVFVAINVIGNYLGIWLVDTSTQFISIPPSQVGGPIGRKWHFCSKCRAMAPPRSWHCTTCGICILKRDHHCVFAGHCVGHANHRYFILFLCWMWVGLLYCSYFNARYIWSPNFIFLKSATLYQLQLMLDEDVLVDPGKDYSWDEIAWDQVAFFLSVVHIYTLIHTSCFLVYHLRQVTAAQTAFESKRKTTEYNLGTRQNLIDVLGTCWYLAIVWPFVASKMPHNGVEWDTQEMWNFEGAKNH